MSTPQITIHYADGTPSVTRDMNAEELAQHEKDILETQEASEAEAAKAAARQAILDRLGLTADEASALLG
jgi:gamma-glutamyl phosphate reductase